MFEFELITTQSIADDGSGNVKGPGTCRPDCGPAFSCFPVTIICNPDICYPHRDPV